MNSVIVSAYYRIPSKQPHEFYVPHLKRFLSGIENFIVFFTEPELVEEFSKLRGNLPIQFVTDFDIFKKRNRQFWERQCLLDCEKYHTPELGAIWYNKKEFVLRSIDLIGKDVPYIWCDAGCIRFDQDVKSFGTHVEKVPKDKLLLQSFHEKLLDEKFFRFPFICIAGAIIAGYPESWKNMSILYDEMVDKYDMNNISCNSDQYILSSLVKKYPKLFKLILVKDWFDLLQVL